MTIKSLSSKVCDQLWSDLFGSFKVKFSSIKVKFSSIKVKIRLKLKLLKLYF